MLIIVTDTIIDFKNNGSIVTICYPAFMRSILLTRIQYTWPLSYRWSDFNIIYVYLFYDEIPHDIFYSIFKFGKAWS